MGLNVLRKEHQRQVVTHSGPQNDRSDDRAFVGSATDVPPPHEPATVTGGEDFFGQVQPAMAEIIAGFSSKLAGAGDVQAVIGANLIPKA